MPPYGEFGPKHQESEWWSSRTLFWHRSAISREWIHPFTKAFIKTKTNWSMYDSSGSVSFFYITEQEYLVLKLKGES